MLQLFFFLFFFFFFFFFFVLLVIWFFWKNLLGLCICHGSKSLANDRWVWCCWHVGVGHWYYAYAHITQLEGIAGAEIYHGKTNK